MTADAHLDRGQDVSHRVLATGTGPVPGTDPRAAAAWLADTVPDLPHVPELPARGPWAQPTGRTCAVLLDLPAQLTPFGWELTRRPGADLRRACALLAEDLDACEEQWPPEVTQVKLHLRGPWSLAAGLERKPGHLALDDAGAVRDLAQSLAVGAAHHVADVRRRLPGRAVWVQIDEPHLVAVLQGSVPTSSRLQYLPVPERSDVTRTLDDVIAAVMSAGAVQAAVAAGAEAVDTFGRAVTGWSPDPASAPGEPAAAWWDAGRSLLLTLAPADGAEIVRRWVHTMRVRPMPAARLVLVAKPEAEADSAAARTTYRAAALAAQQLTKEW